MAAGVKDPDIARVLFSAAEIRSAVERLAARISREYAGKKLAVVGILKGSVVFLADLIRSLQIPCSVDFIAVSSYAKGASSGKVRTLMDLREDPRGKHILLVEDVLDTGRTMRHLVQSLKPRRPRSLKVCALLDKPDCRKVRIAADYVGFRIPNHFVVGYGLDFAERYRQLPYIGILKDEVLARTLNKEEKEK